MDDKTIEKIEYAECLIDIFFWLFITMIWYKNLLFRCLFKLTYSESKLVLCAMIICITVFMIVVIYKKQSAWVLMSSLLLSYGTYTVMTYWNTINSKILLTLGIAFCVAVSLNLLVMTRRIPKTKRRKRILKRRVHKCLINTLNIMSIAMAIIMLPMIVGSVFGGSLLKTHTEAKAGVSVENQTLSGNMDMVLKLQEDEWERLTTKDKLEVMQTIANIEVHYLGIPNEINIGIANLRENTLACYSDSIHTVYISLEHIEEDSAHEVLNSCCHEVYHCYQHRLVDAFNDSGEELRGLRIFKGVADYIDEFESYTDGYQDFCAYYSQQCEQDARWYAENAVEDYYSRIEAYLGTY